MSGIFAVKVCLDHCELLGQFISDQTKLDAVQWKCIWRGSTMPLWTESQYLIADHPRTKWSKENGNITNMSSRRRKYSENITFAYSSILPPAMPSYSQISHFGGIQAYFHFMSSHLSYAQTFPHSTITNILKKTVLKPCLISSIHIFAHLQTFSLWNFEALKIVFLHTLSQSFFSF